MKTSRQRLLHYIEKKQVATVREISLALKMTPANARHHLSILIDQGSVEISGKRVGQGGGRPNNLYIATKSNQKNNLNNLSRGLLTLIMEAKNNQEREEQYRKLARILIEEEIPQSKQPTKKLNDAIRILNQMRYEARWEAHLTAPHIILENCPYAEIIEDFPEICLINKFIIEQLIDCPVTQSVKFKATKTGMHRCIFVLDEE